MTVATTLLAPIGISLWQRGATARVPSVSFGRGAVALPVRIPVTTSEER
jgi:hypothetical protein